TCSSLKLPPPSGGIGAGDSIGFGTPDWITCTISSKLPEMCSQPPSDNDGPAAVPTPPAPWQAAQTVPNCCAPASTISWVTPAGAPAASCGTCAPPPTAP